MVMLLFYVGEDRYACDCDYITEIIACVPLKQVTHTPDYLAGLVRYSGLLIPVLDLAQLLDGRPCAHVLSTRIVILRENPKQEPSQHMGLIAERVTEMIPQFP